MKLTRPPHLLTQSSCVYGRVIPCSRANKTFSKSVPSNYKVLCTYEGLGTTREPTIHTATVDVYIYIYHKYSISIYLCVYYTSIRRIKPDTYVVGYMYKIWCIVYNVTYIAVSMGIKSYTRWIRNNGVV